MKLPLMLGVVALLLAGCAADGGFVGSPNAMIGDVDTPWITLNVVPTIVQKDASPMGAREGSDGSIEDAYSTYIRKPDGTVTVTGPWVRYMTLAQLCAKAPQAQPCSEDALTE